MKNHLFIVSIALLFLFSCKQKKHNSQSQMFIKLDSLINAEHIANRFDGTIAIGNKDSIIFTKAIGNANRIWDMPLQMNHRFDICSINKSFIATLILIAVEEGKINLNDLLIDKINSDRYSGNFNKKITIQHMLTHTSGLPNYDDINKKLSANQFQSFKRLHFSNNEYIDFISKIAPKNQPGLEFCYSNFAYHLLTILLEDLYQQTFSEILQDKICKPLGLSKTFSTSSNSDVFSQVVEAYNYDQSNDSWNRNKFIDLTLGRRIFSSSIDLYKWGKAIDSDILLSNKMNSLMQTNHISDITDKISYGYGWVVFDEKANYKMGDLKIDKKYVIHGGNTEGFKSMIVNIEKGEFIIAFLANIGDQTNEMLLTQKIVQILTQ